MYDVTVIGAGIVGLASARELLRRHPRLRVAVLDKEAAAGRHQTGHNSGVIHSGIYYAPGSLKARLCIDGRRQLLDYCHARGIEFRRVGKLIVALSEDELPRLNALWDRGIANGIEGLEMIDGSGIRKREPHCAGIGAIFSPVTGIVDYGAVASALAEDILAMRGEILPDHRVTAISLAARQLEIKTGAGTIISRALIGCAGLYADRLAQMTGGSRDPKIVPFRGDYFVLKPKSRHLIKGNIYPVPDPAFPFLGAHFTPRMNGDVWLGPNAVLAFAREGYTFGTVNSGEVFETLTYPGLIRLALKYPAVAAGELYRDLFRGAYVDWLRKYVPELRNDDVLPGPSGVRAQAMNADGTLVDDFIFDGSANVLHVRNAPSPAATACLAIGAHIAARASEQFSL
ncbi:MAG TPA: L-2-hydroxyglutarate oxidase [Candidatus Rubrimentiphilum sp.]|nr:L-2-hydroxyglutarate oxidase [Candidatus Rubrimentiphilum sp.]